MMVTVKNEHCRFEKIIKSDTLDGSTLRFPVRVFWNSAETQQKVLHGVDYSDNGRKTIFECCGR